LVFVATYCLACCLATFSANAAKPEFSPVIQSVLLSFPRDFGAHPAFRNEWWYVTDWLETPDKNHSAFRSPFSAWLPNTTPTMLQDPQGFSRKGPRPEQASYYYSEPQLQVTGTVTRNGKGTAISGIAWLDHLAAHPAHG
jgi:predicted secreted hydrolase